MDLHPALPRSARVGIQFSFLSWRPGMAVEPLLRVATDRPQRPRLYWKDP
jgi:hypothetical protein